MSQLEANISREQAFDLLKAHNSDEYHILHAEQLEALMRYYAERFDPENVEFWGLVGLLHDLDWEEWPDEQAHTVKTAELLAEAGAGPSLARSIQTHNSDHNPSLPAPELQMEKVLYAIDELSGLINACVLMRPSHSVSDFSVKSLKKKFKTRSFAAGCDRDVIEHGADLLGVSLDELFASVIEAEKSLVGISEAFA